MSTRNRIGMLLSMCVAVLGGWAMFGPIDTGSGQRSTTPQCRGAALAPTTITAGGETTFTPSFSGLRAGQSVRVTISGMWLGPSLELRGQTAHWFFQDAYLDLVAEGSSRWPVVVGGQEYVRDSHGVLMTPTVVLAGRVPSSGTVSVRFVNANATDGNPTAHGAFAELCVY